VRHVELHDLVGLDEPHVRAFNWREGCCTSELRNIKEELENIDARLKSRTFKNQEERDLARAELYFHFLASVPECRVHLLYFPGAQDNPVLIERLKKMAIDADINLYVGLMSIGQPDYVSYSQKFKLCGLPALIMTGSSEIASVKDTPDWATAFIRLDNKRLIQNTDNAMNCLEDCFNLFLRGEVKVALERAVEAKKAATFEHYLKKAKLAGKEISKGIKERDWTLDIFRGTIESKYRGDPHSIQKSSTPTIAVIH